MVLPELSNASSRLAVALQPRHEPVLPAWLEGGLAVLDERGEIVEVNEPLAAWLEKPASELLGQRIVAVLASRCASWLEAWEALDKPSRTFAQAKWELPANDLEPARWFQAELTRLAPRKLFRLNSILPPTAGLQEAGCQQCLTTDPSRREMFFRVLRSEEQLRQVMERWPGIIFSQRPEGSFYYVSPRIEELTGVPVADWEQQPRRFWDVIHEADLPQVQQHFQQATTSSLPLSCSFRVRHIETGKVAYIAEHRQAISTSNGVLLGFEGMWVDLTRQTLAEKRLNATAWKETLASLTMGLAHDFRNIMAGVLGLTETLQLQLDKEHPAQQGLALLRSNAWQANHSAQRILQLYQTKGGEKSYQDLNELVQEMTEMTQKMLSRRISVATQLADGRLPLYLDPFEFRQAFLNLALNARDAMPDGGQLTFTTSRHDKLPELNFVKGSLPRLPAICLAVTDTGCGIPAQHLASIFDPYFTTKALDKGTGLGLYNVLSFVEKNQGAISVDSQEGQGATFRLWVPEADFTEAERQPAAPAERETLLLLGAPGQAFDSTADFLRQNGFFIVTALGLEAARDRLRSPHRRVAGVILQTTAQYPALFADIKRDKLPVKTILQVIGRNLDELEGSLVNGADLVISLETTGAEIAGRIRSLLAGSS